MNGFLLLLYCIEILSAQLGRAEISSDRFSTNEITSLSTESSTTRAQISDVNTSSVSPSPLSKATAAATATATTTTTTTTTSSTTDAPSPFYLKSECLSVTMVAGGLILACTILLISTLMLTCKVCQLSRHLKRLNSNADLCSNSENWMVTAKKGENKSEPEAKETSMLMADMSQTQEDIGNGTNKDEGGKVNEDEQRAEENKKEVEGTANSKEASAGENKKETPITVAENPSTCQPQEDTTNSQSGVVAASPSEGTEKPKDAV